MMNSFKEFDVYVTVTGFRNFPNAKRLLDGDKVILCREPENDYDTFAISVHSEFGKIGYVANSEKTVRPGTLSATRLSELISDTATAEVIEGGYYEAICKVNGIFDMDKMILEACKSYDVGNYADALPLFLKICDKYNSLLLMQYTADCLIKLGEYKESIQFSKRAIMLDEDNKVSMMMYATALHKLKYYDEAIDLYTKILELSENELVREALKDCQRLKENEKQV